LDIEIQKLNPVQ